MPAKSSKPQRLAVTKLKLTNGKKAAVHALHCMFWLLVFPIDFKAFNEKVLEPRAREKKNPKPAPN
jgi:hypothetical protein